MASVLVSYRDVGCGLCGSSSSEKGMASVSISSREAGVAHVLPVPVKEA